MHSLMGDPIVPSTTAMEFVVDNQRKIGLKWVSSLGKTESLAFPMYTGRPCMNRP